MVKRALHNAEMVVEEEDDLVLCSFMAENRINKRKRNKKKVKFESDIKKPLEAGLLYTRKF